VRDFIERFNRPDDAVKATARTPARRTARQS
jgi:hypothetical protein